MKNLALIIFSLFILSNCAAQRDTKPKVRTQMIEEAPANVETGMIHTVYFWLVDDISEEGKQVFEKGLEDLALVPSIDKFYWGKPAATEKRDVIDDSYHYAINVFFKSLEDQAAYQVDELHLKFVADHEAIFKKVIVYDNTY